MSDKTQAEATALSAPIPLWLSAAVSPPQIQPEPEERSAHTVSAEAPPAGRGGQDITSVCGSIPVVIEAQVSTPQPAIPLESPAPLRPLAPSVEGARSRSLPPLAASATGAGAAAKLAFAARLIPTITTDEQTTPGAPRLPRVSPEAPIRPEASGQMLPDQTLPDQTLMSGSGSADKGVTAPMAAFEASGDPGQDHPGLGNNRGGSDHGSLSAAVAPATSKDRSSKTEEFQPAADEVPQAAPGGSMPHAGYSPESRAGNVSVHPGGTPSAESTRPKDGSGPQAGSEPPAMERAGGERTGNEAAKPPAAARDIRIEVGGGDRRVEVRLRDRGGEVQVVVRTPDNRLAAALREDLPALSSRLAESGYRAETWHPAASGTGDWSRQAEPSRAGTRQDTNGQPREHGREQQPDERQLPRPKVPDEQSNKKQKGRDFEWFISTLR